MNPQSWFTLGGIIGQVVIAAYVYGKLTGKVSEHERRHDNVDTDQKDQWETIGRHGERITAVETSVRSWEHGQGRNL